MALDLEELLKNINEKMPDEVITISDLRRPTTEFMMRYFFKVCVELGVADTTHSVLQRMDNPEMYKDIIQYSTVFKMIRKLYPIPEHLKGFTIMSLMDPQPEDIRYVFYVDAYFDFYYQRIMQLYIPKATEIEELKKEVEILKNKKEELETKLNMLVREQGKVNKDAVKIEEALSSLTLQLEELKGKNTVEAEKLELMKKKRSALQETAAAKWKEVQEVAAFAELYREREQLQTCLAKTEEELKKQKEDLVELEQKKADKVEQQKFYEEAVVQEREYKEYLTKLREIYKAERQAAQEEAEAEEKIRALNEKISEIQNKSKTFQQRSEEAARNLRIFQSQNKKTVSSQKKKLDSLKKQVKATEDKLKDTRDLHEQLKIRAQQMESLLQDVKDRRKKLDLQYREGFDLLKEKFHTYQEKMYKLLE